MALVNDIYIPKATVLHGKDDKQELFMDALETIKHFKKGNVYQVCFSAYATRSLVNHTDGIPKTCYFDQMVHVQETMDYWDMVRVVEKHLQDANPDWCNVAVQSWQLIANKERVSRIKKQLKLKHK